MDSSPVLIPNPYPHGDASYREHWLPRALASRPSRVPAVVTSLGLEQDAQGALLSVTTQLKPRLLMRVPAAECLSSAGDGAQDLAEVPMAGLNVPAVALSLARRALAGQCVTRVTPAMWLSLNPCRVALDAQGVSLHDVLYMARTRAVLALGPLPAPAGGAASGSRSAQPPPPPPPPPHVFEAAESALCTLHARRASTALVFVGEAGAGKSEAYKAALSYLAAIPALAAAGVQPGCLDGAAAAASAPTSATAVRSHRSRIEMLLAHLPSHDPSDALGAAPAPAGDAAGRGREGSAHALGRCLLLTDPDLELAARDAGRRKGPLGSSRNPWFTSGSTVPKGGLTSTFADGFAGGGSGSGGSGGEGLPWGMDAYRLLQGATPRLCRVLLAAHTLLDAFGSCASATQGPNASAHVKSVELHYSPLAAAVGGAVQHPPTSPPASPAPASLPCSRAHGACPAVPQARATSTFFTSCAWGPPGTCGSSCAWGGARTTGACMSAQRGRGHSGAPWGAWGRGQGRWRWRRQAECRTCMARPCMCTLGRA